MSSGCAFRGGCLSDYIAVAIAACALILLFFRSTYPFVAFKRQHTFRSSGFWLVTAQFTGSLDLVLSLVMSVNYFDKKHFWQSCYTWAVWFEGPLGFGLLMSCRIVQAFQLHYLFVKQRLPPVQCHVILPIILFPWVVGAAFTHVKKPLNQWCHMRSQWVIPVVCIHSLYLAVLVTVTWTIRHIKFRFREFKDLLRGIAVSTVAIGLWIVAYVLNEVHEDVSWIQVASRFFLLVMASILVLAFFSLSVSQPLLSQISLRHKEYGIPTMRQALGIVDSGAVINPSHSCLDLSEPLEKLLLSKKFRQSFMEFSDSCLAGESVHFYEEVHELMQLPITDAVRRIYMARHVIEKYIITGAEMEVNISHRTRQEILGTLDLAVPSLFDRAVTELVHLMKTNLVKDYWSSTHYARLIEELRKETRGFGFRETVGSWDFSPRPSSVQCADDPFHQVQNLNPISGRSNSAQVLVTN